MADGRLQYPLLPSYVQQQSHQIPPHQQQQPQDSLPAFPDNSRMWQHPQQMRSHPPDISHPQMADLFRNPAMMRLQQAQGQPSPQQFSPGLAMPQLASNQNINGPPQSSQDLSAGQPQPSHMPPANFNGISNPNAHMGSAAAQQRNNPLLPNFSRPYDLGFPQNHHPQNGALAFANKQGIPSMQQQSRDQQHLQPPNHNSTAGMFSSPTMQSDAVRRPSPSHPPMPSQHMQNGMMTSAVQQNNTHTQPVPQTSMSFASRPLPEQAIYLRNMIQNLNNNIAAHRSSPQDVDHMTKARVAATYMSKRDTAVKMLNNVLAQMQAQSGGGGGGQGQMPWMQQQQQQQGPSQPSFDAVSMPRNGLGQPQVQHQPGNANSLVHSTQAGQVGGQNPLNLQHNPSSVQGNHVNVAGSSFPSQSIIPPNAASFNVPSVQAQQVQRGAPQPGGTPNPMLQMIPPLEKNRFEMAFKTFCNNKQIKIDQQLLTVNNRPIDLHMLHTLVMVEGGEGKVQQKDLWSVIGGRMGFVQFPGTDSTEPSKSGPVIAQQLEHIYRQFLADFDRAYTASVLDLRVRNNGLAVSHLNPSQLNMMVSMADQPVPQLKAQGLSEPIIQFIETHRSHLQRLRRERESSRDAMKPNTAEQSAQGGQANGVPHINQMAGLRPPPFLQPGQSNISQLGGHNVESRQQLTHQLPPQTNALRPSKEQAQHALALVAKARQETMNNIQNRPWVNIPAEQRFEYNTLLEQLSRHAMEMDNKLAMLYISTRKEEFVRRLIVLVVSIQHQRNLLTSPNPRFFLSLDNLRVLHQQMQQATESCSQLFAALSQQKLQMQQQQQHQQQQQQQIQSGPRPLNARNFPLDTPQIRPTGASNPLISSPNLQPPPPQQPTPPQISLHPPPPKKKGPTPALPTAPQTTTSTPSPVPTSAHTPGPASGPSSSTPLNTNTPTPALPPSSSSPPASRSPKGKTSAKAKQAPAPTHKRRPSRATAATPSVPAESPAATVASSSTPNSKRQREGDDNVVDADSIGNNVSVANEPSPPKRAKTDWEIPQSEELKKKAAEVKVESVEDTNLFLEQMEELLKKKADSEGQESAWYTDLTETIGTILKGCASETSDNSLFGEAIIGRESSPSTVLKDAFEEFIDYSCGQPDGQLDHEEGSKAHTPDLVSSSSTNLSPESNTDGDNSLSTMSSLSDIRKDDPHDLRLGLWKEVDGGESAYYQPFEWKWDGPMSILEQSWAVSTS